MIPQTQRWFHGAVRDEHGRQTDDGGDCFAACLASILELPIEGFPNFLAGENGGWWLRWKRWLYDNYRLDLVFWDEDEKDKWPDVATSFVWWIGEVMHGPTSHSVVFYRDEFRWDPAPHPYKREWSFTDVRSIVAPFSVASIWDRPAGPDRLLVAAADGAT